MDELGGWTLVVVLAGAGLGWLAARRRRQEPEFTGSEPDPRLLDEEYLAGELTRAQYEAEQQHLEAPPERPDRP